MKAQRWSDQVENWWSVLQFNLWEVSITWQVAESLVAADALPVIRGLQRQLRILGGFEVDDGQAFRSRHGKKVQDTMLARTFRNNLLVDAIGVQSHIDTTDILAHEVLHPAFRLRSIQGVLKIVGKGIAEIFEILNRLVKLALWFW